jgi:hypothetical protein
MMLGFIQQSIGQGTVTFNFTTSGAEQSWTAPAYVTTITVEAWGGGGAGGGSAGACSGGGGGGGGYTKNSNVSVVPGNSYNIVVGWGGLGMPADGNAGGTSSFGTTTVTANGGGGGKGSNPAGAGGTGGTYNGGAGAAGVGFNYGGGGGGSAGTASNGNTATNGTGALAVTGGGAGGSGGATGSPGGLPGGGGGGGYGLGPQTGGSGGNGKVVITWTCTPPAAPTVSSPVTYTQYASSVPLSATGVNLRWYTIPVGGTGSSTAPTPSTATGGTTSYYVSSTTVCEGPRAQINVIVTTPTASVTHSNLTCFASNDGTITITAAGGAVPYQFSIDNGDTWTSGTNPNPYTFTGLFPNHQYKIRVKDSNNATSPILP